MNIIKLITSFEYRQEWFLMRAMNKAKRTADKLHKLTGYKYYVIMYGKKLTPVNMVWINRMKKLGLWPKRYDALQLEKESYYVTK